MSIEIRRALISWLNYPPETSETLSGLAWQMVREAKKCGAILAPYYVEMASHIEALEAENVRLSDKVDGLKSDLDNAIETAYHRGAVDWVRMNYPKHFASLSQAKE